MAVPVFKNVGEKSAAKDQHPEVLFLCLIVFEKLLNNRIIDNLEKSSIFSDLLLVWFQVFFINCRSSDSCI